MAKFRHARQHCKRVLIVLVLVLWAALGWQAHSRTIAHAVAKFSGTLSRDSPPTVKARPQEHPLNASEALLVVENRFRVQMRAMVRTAEHRAWLRARSVSRNSHNAAHQRKHQYSVDQSTLYGDARVLYGIATCSAPGFPDIVEAIFDTWAKPLPRQQLILSGGLRDDNLDGLQDEVMPCGDSAKDFWCKEAVTIWRAARRAKAMNAGWLCVSQEDKYIWTKQVDAALKTHDSTKPLVFASWGCARHWRHMADAKMGILPKPAHIADVPYCEAVHKSGSICGGPGYFVSRGMLDALVDGIETLTDFLASYRSAAAVITRTGASDVLSTCFFYKRLPRGEWRLTLPDKPWVGTPDNEAITTKRLANANSFLNDGIADPATFLTSWQQDHEKLPLTLHLDQKFKRDVPSYMRELYANGTTS